MKIRLILLLFISFSTSLFCQYAEVGGDIGLSNYSGDLSPSGIGPIISQSHPTFSGFLKYHMNDRFSSKFAVMYGGISGADSNSDRESQKKRNLDFYSDIYEVSVMLEFNILPYSLLRGKSSFTPYISLGFAAFKFDPYTTHNGVWVQLQPLGTEGQGTSAFPGKAKYSLLELNIPFGGGVKIKLSDQISGFASLNWRWTFTDYLDDVSTVYVDAEILSAENGELSAILSNKSGSSVSTGEIRGGKDVNDYYATGTIGISYAFINGTSLFYFRNKRGRSKSRVICPEF